MITWDAVAALDPKLVDPAVPLEQQAAILTAVYQILPADTWGTRLDLAATFLAAHFGVTQARGGGVGVAGIILSASVGGASVSYANPYTQNASGFAGDFGNSIWGQRFQMLVDSLFTAMVT